MLGSRKTVDDMSHCDFEYVPRVLGGCGSIPVQRRLLNIRTTLIVLPTAWYIIIAIPAKRVVRSIHDAGLAGGQEEAVGCEQEQE